MTSTDRSSTRRGRGRPPSGSEDKRERILREAVSLFAERGYAGTSIADIAAAAAISKAGLLHHFSSKDELFAQVLARRDEDSAREFLGQVDDPWEYLHAFVRLVENNTRQRDLVALYTATAVSILNADHPAHQWFARHLSDAVEQIEDLLEAGKREGTVKEEAPSRAIARTIVALSDGLQMQWLCATTPQTQACECLDTDMVSEIRMAVEAIEERWRLDPAAQ